ncbi:multidrug resistance protein Fnx1 [Aspergillus parasiticus]|uniref:Multidrug resistance protein Fnx1 n=1 Tax=Aspergillus parasiticus TaxID=5067 RepID=A0A5N6D5I4_ASPPA|nr:multidrug resistance protein Fnx1 [Aspergillus parasiticus]
MKATSPFYDFKVLDHLDSQELYVWAINGYFVSQTAVQPLYGQVANIFGRRWPTILFPSSTGMLIAARVIQGLGGGGINVMTEIIVADLVPLRERQQVMGIIFTAFAVGTFIGPVVGRAIVDHTSWRWVFYINLPLCGVTLILMLLFLHVNYDHQSTVTAKLKRVDFAGNAILITSAGTTHTWQSWRTIVPLLLGFAGMVAFLVYQGSRWCLEPTMSLRLFASRTAALTYILSFLHGIILYWASFFLPVYFQSVLEAKPEKSGIDLFASVIPMVPGAIIGGVLITVTGKYKPLLVARFVLMAIGMGLFTMLDDRTNTVRWVVHQVTLALGSGISLIATLPAILASFPESDVATATATWALLRSFGSIWGVSIPSVIFQYQLRGVLVGSGAYQLATKAFIQSLDDTPVVKAQVVSVYVDSLKLVWQVGIAFAALGVPLSLLIRSLALRDELNTEFGFEEKKTEDIEEVRV